jgi:hypothetical protein
MSLLGADTSGLGGPFIARESVFTLALHRVETNFAAM